jgi:hypothetical protein
MLTDKELEYVDFKNIKLKNLFIKHRNLRMGRNEISALKATTI